MAQFDVHATQGRMRERAAYVVVIQSARFDRSLTRLVAPLVSASAQTAQTEVTPSFSIEGRSVILHPLQIFAMPVTSLGAKVGSLADDGSSGRILAAIDEVLSRAFG